MGSVFHGVPLDLARSLVAKCQLAVAVETGTYLGDSALELATMCERVITIERDVDLHAAAQARLADHANISTLLGPSVDHLRALARELPPALYWLDAHWSGTGTSRADDECPLLSEIDAIDSGPNAAAAVFLIDDARFFTAPPPPPHDAMAWPPYSTIVGALERVPDRFVTLCDDVIVAGPPDARTVVAEYERARRSGAIAAPAG